MTDATPGLAPVPAHVPPELVYDFDLYDGPGLGGGHAPDLHLRWKAFQDTHPPIFWTPRNGGHWALTRYNVIQEAALQPEVFSSRDIFVPQGSAPFLIPTNSDAPMHAKYRQLLQPFFTPAALARLTDAAREVTVELIEQIKPAGGCEFVSAFSSVMPVVVFMTLVNLPRSDLNLLLGIAKRMTPRDPESNARAWADLSDYVRRQIDLRRTHPQGDFISTLLAAEVDGRRLTEDEIFSMTLLVVSGGLDTVKISLTFAAAFLAQHPAHRRELREHPDRIDNAVNEMLRRFGVSNIARVVAADTTFHGLPMKAGESLLLMYPLAGLDEAVTDDPLTVDFQRSAPRHMVFGTGPHTCLGNRLGKRELRLFLEEWLTRIPEFSLAPGTEPKGTCGVTNVIEELHLVWDCA